MSGSRASSGSHMDKLLPIKIPPGMRNTGTVYQSKRRWYTGNFVRFFNDAIQPIGGWASRTLTGATISGVPRAAISYQVSGTQLLVIGTTRGIYVISGTVKYDITPSDIVSNNIARVWQFDVFGEYLVAVNFIAPSTGGVLYYWTGNTGTLAASITNGPVVGGIQTSQNARSVVGTPERFLVMLGGTTPALTP